jgi:hypothetical protein
MKHLIRTSLLSIIFLTVGTAFAGVPPLKVTVSDSAGKVAFKGATNSSGAFATKSLAAGNYVVQFNASDSSLKGQALNLIVSAGKKKVTAEAISGDKLLAGGVAMKVDVGANLNITGQASSAANAKIDPKTKKKLVYIRPALGSNLPGRWVPEDSAEAVAARNSGELRTEDMRKWQDHGDATALGR